MRTAAPTYRKQCRSPQPDLAALMAHARERDRLHPSVRGRASSRTCPRNHVRGRLQMRLPQSRSKASAVSVYARCATCPGLRETQMGPPAERHSRGCEACPQVRLANVMRLIAGLPERLGHGGCVIVQRNPICAHAMAACGKPGEEGGTGGRTQRIGNVSARENRAASRQRVDVRCPNNRMAGVPQARRMVLVGRDDEKVGTVSRSHRM